MKKTTYSIIFCSLLILLFACKEENPMNLNIQSNIVGVEKYFNSKQYGEQAYKMALDIAKGNPLDTEALKRLGTDINNRYGDEITLLFFAVRCHNTEAMDVLLAHGADPYQPDRVKKRTRGNFASYGARTMPKSLNADLGNAMFRLYLKHGGDPDYKTASGVPLIYSTMIGNNFDNFKLLIEAGANPWAVEKNGKPPYFSGFEVAAGAYNYEFIYYALEHDLFASASSKDISRLIYEIATTYIQRGDKISQEFQKITQLILDKTNYKGDGYSAMTLAGETIFNTKERIAKYGKGFGDEGFLENLLHEQE